MFKHLLCITFILSLFSCRQQEHKRSDVLSEVGDTLAVNYSHKFSIIQYPAYKILEVKNPWPDAHKTFKYLLYEKGARLPKGIQFDAKIQVPVNRMVATSTTYIPQLEALHEENTLIGFPGLDYISSEKTRKLIASGKIHELGKNEDINTEVLISQKPDVVIGFAVNGNNKTYNLIQKTGIPVVFNADWTEESPLGKAEWIKFFGAFYNKTSAAKKIFQNTVKNYQQAKELANSAEESPKVLSGSMFKDQWYVPYGNSWQAKFISDANASYIYSETRGSGSRSLAFETVLHDGKNADFWIAPGQFTSYSQLMESSKHYARFKSVQNHKVYTYSNTTGKTGGILYYELAPSRPDLVLKDLIHIFHPSLLPEYQPVFFKPLK